MAAAGVVGEGLSEEVIFEQRPEVGEEGHLCEECFRKR